MADHAKPILTDNYTDVLSQIRGRFEDQAKGFDPANTTATNISTGTIRWNSAEKKFQKWSGTAWGDLTDNYVLSGATFSAGTANGVAYLNSSKVLTTGSALTFDGTNFGIGTNTPLVRLDVQAPANGLLANFMENTSGATRRIRFSNNGTTNTIESTTGVGSTTLAFAVDGSEQMRLTSTGLGIGTSSPGNKLSIAGYSSANQLPDIQITRTSSGTTIQTGPNITFSDGTTISTTSLQVTQGRFGVWNYGGGTWAERLSVDASGNLGLGVTPSAWGGSGAKAFEIGTWSGLSDGGAYGTVLTFNGRYNSGWFYKNTNQATKYEQDGSHRWYIAPSGTAGSAISFTQAMTLNANGNLLVGNTNGTSRITASGVIESTTGGFKFPDGTTQTTAATAPSTANVLAATAGATVGAVGTYAMLRNYGVQGHIEPGQVVAGANLSYASATGTEARPVPSGSNWLCMGHAMGTQLAVSLGDRTTLFLRVS